MKNPVSLNEISKEAVEIAINFLLKEARFEFIIINNKHAALKDEEWTKTRINNAIALSLVAMGLAKNFDIILQENKNG